MRRFQPLISKMSAVGGLDDGDVRLIVIAVLGQDLGELDAAVSCVDALTTLFAADEPTVTVADVMHDGDDDVGRVQVHADIAAIFARASLLDHLPSFDGVGGIEHSAASGLRKTLANSAVRRRSPVLHGRQVLRERQPGVGCQVIEHNHIARTGFTVTNSRPNGVRDVGNVGRIHVGLISRNWPRLECPRTSGHFIWAIG